jgi:hypothetical protein
LVDPGKKIWTKIVEDDVRRCALSSEDAKDKSLWERKDSGRGTADLGKSGYIVAMAVS